MVKYKVINGKKYELYDYSSTSSGASATARQLHGGNGWQTTTAKLDKPEGIMKYGIFVRIPEETDPWEKKHKKKFYNSEGNLIR